MPPSISCRAVMVPTVRYLLRSRLFVGLSDAEHRRFVEMLREDLQPNGQAFRRFAAGYAHARYTGQVTGQRVYVGKIHRKRIFYLFADLERRKRRNRGDDRVHLPERLTEVASNQRANLLRLLIVSVVVAGTQNVRAEHDPPLHFVSEAIPAGIAIHFGQRTALGSRRITNPIVAGEVRA